MIIFFFKKTEKETEENNYQEDYLTLQKKYEDLSKKIQKLEKLKGDAQQHALQTAIINRVFAQIRTSENVESLIKNVILEIHELLGSYKTYFVRPGSKFYKISIVNSNNYNADLGKKIRFDNQVIQNIKNFKIYTSPCLKEGLNSEEMLTKGTQRVIIPISDGKKSIGAIVSLTVQSVVVKANLALLQTITEQLTGAVTRTALTENIKKQNKKQ